MSIDQSKIRNFCIIAHIDHGKSTLADRIIERTGTLTSREMQAQVLDNMDLERERGITIKSQAVRIIYKANDGEEYIFNLIDTPGHVDFNYEVSRSLAACDGAILVVDAAQGVEAQTLANVYLALDHDLDVMPVINKIDLPSAQPDEVVKEIEDVIGIEAEDAPRISAKTGLNIDQVLEQIVTKIPAPTGDKDAPLQALIFDALYDSYKGVIVFCRIKEGTVKVGDTIRMMATGAQSEVTEIGYFGAGQFIPCDELAAGMVGYICASIKNVRDTRVGDTVTNANRPCSEPLPGYKKVNPMVYCGMYPADDKDVPVFTGRFNIGAVSLHLPMILAKARSESRDFYEVLDYYLEMIRNLHKRTYEYLGAMKASTNPLAYCEGGFYGGHLKPNERIKKLLKPMTASFGITALNELQELYNGKSITEDGEFALEVLEYINKKVSEFKEEDGWLYAIYGTPAESLCGLQVEQFRKKYGIVENVSDRPYASNSFHCHVTEDITPIEKQDLEGRFWELCNGGKIQYVRYPIDYNVQAIKSLIRRAMDLGYYEGVNLSLAYCDDCGHQELEMDVCPKCGSKNLTKIDRMNGYLSYSRVHGDTRLNEAKMAEIAERVSM